MIMKFFTFNFHAVLVWCVSAGLRKITIREGVKEKHKGE